MIRDFFSHTSIYDDCRRPRRVAPAADLEQTIQNPLPAVPRRGPEAGLHQIYYDFHDLGLNHIDSCLFLQSTFIKKRLKAHKTHVRIVR